MNERRSREADQQDGELASDNDFDGPPDIFAQTVRELSDIDISPYRLYAKIL